jgi:acyl carrier protein
MKPTNLTMLKIMQITADKLGIDQSQLTYKTSFSDDLGADSLDIYELIMTIEKEFKLKIDEEHVEKLTTIGALIDYIDSRLAPQKHQMEPFKVVYKEQYLAAKTN